MKILFHSVRSEESTHCIFS